mmetsp:Transcript_23569/g.23764  ORF Transcript_23569/g.23764 Transcript_23569/m.23764 type:complete len:263 (+) Transcript_23569:139-927(+)
MSTQSICNNARLISSFSRSFKLNKGFTASKGGQLRTFWSFVKSLNTNTISLDRYPIILYSADTDDTSNSNTWKTYSDQEYGGNSSCAVTHNSIDTNTQFIRFTGELNFQRPEALTTSDSENPVRTATRGYCATKYDFSSVLDLRDMEGLELIVRSATNRNYVFNMSCVSFFEGDIYQIGLELPANKWCTVRFPFDTLRLTAMGRQRDVQRVNDNLEVEGIGFLVDSGTDPFQLDISSVTALPELDRQDYDNLKNNIIKRTTS